MSTEAGALANFDRAMRRTFSWYTVSKKEFKDAIRSKGLWLLGVIFTLLFVSPVAGALYLDFGAGTSQQAQAIQQQGMQFLLSSLYTNTVTILVPIIAIFVGYAAISKERTSGSMKILLSLPHSRRDVLVGKVIGRCAVLGVPLVVSLAVTAAFLMASELAFKPELFALFSLFSVLYALVFVAITVSISGAFKKTLWSGAASFMVYFYSTFLWNATVNSFGQLLQQRLGVTGAIRWHLVLLLKLANPNQAYKTLTTSMLNTGDTPVLRARLSMFGGNADTQTICTEVLNGTWTSRAVQFGGQTVQVPTCNGGGTPVPFFYSDPVVAVFMVAWIGIAATVSYYTFSLADL
ncbi:ABC transporter permease [Haloarcula sp. S1CR25-12]|uniref:ABC transporter permease n=1 Tax=Haloarcula saliterrae TaxID=2950534 RepID=A0ABU2FCF9_9EURY|nr:ABC transporter permease subunit [Haloarcula sp. S1CR25-12]MDS0259943.1 ABC transporter permease [Haloarcula sp. S1CR25-12]